MSKYTVIKFFTDLQDGRHAYNVGDTFPRDGLVVSKERFEELAGSKNKQGQPLIKAVEIEGEEEPKQKRSTRRGRRKKSDAE